jgi:hypothetical protein
MPVGAGFTPAGFSPAGYGTIDVAPAPALVPLPDYRTGLSDSGRYINQKTGDYAWTADGRLQGMPTVNQLVLLAIRNNVDLSTLQVKGPNFNATLTAIVQDALSDLITRKLVLLVSVVIAPSGLGINPDAGIAVASWLDLTTGSPQQTPF